MDQIRLLLRTKKKNGRRPKYSQTFHLLFTLLERVTFQRNVPLMDIRISFLIYFDVVQCLENIIIRFRGLFTVWQVENGLMIGK